MPPLPQPEEGHALTHEAKELGLTSSEEARLVTNFVKHHFFREITYMSHTNFRS